MKKILLAFPIVLLGALIAPAFAGANTNNNYTLSYGKKKKNTIHVRKEKNLNWANYQTVQQFELDFPNAHNVKWYQGYFSEATFRSGKSMKTAYYDSDDMLVGTTSVVPYSKLPKKAHIKISKFYPGYNVGSVIFFKDNPDNDTNMSLYSTAFDDMDSYFVELTKGTKKIVVKADTDGQVSFFQNL